MKFKISVFQIEKSQKVFLFKLEKVFSLFLIKCHLHCTRSCIVVLRVSPSVLAAEHAYEPPDSLSNCVICSVSEFSPVILMPCEKKKKRNSHLSGIYMELAVVERQNCSAVIIFFNEKSD